MNMTKLEIKMLAELRAVLPLLDLAFDHQDGEDVFGRRHNDAIDVYQRIEQLIKEGSKK